MFAETGTDECLFLVATCYYRSGKVDQAYHILQVSRNIIAGVVDPDPVGSGTFPGKKLKSIKIFKFIYKFRPVNSGL